MIIYLYISWMESRQSRCNEPHAARVMNTTDYVHLYMHMQIIYHQN